MQGQGIRPVGRAAMVLCTMCLLGIAPSIIQQTPVAVAQNRNINGAQQRMRERMIREVGGQSPRVNFDPQYTYTALSGNRARIEGTGAYQSSITSLGRGFRYRCTYRTNNSNIVQFSFTWLEGDTTRPPDGSDSDYNGRAEIAWRGMVDDTVEIRFRESRALVRTLSGSKTTNIRKWVRESVPRRTMNIRINKLRGRGQVSIQEQPNRNNNYTLLVRVQDPDPSADPYLFELLW